MRGVGRALMRNHLRHCATKAIQKGTPEEAQGMYDELLELVYKHPALTTKPKKETDMKKDLVCGMQVDPKKAAGTSEYQGKTYYFCSAGCKKKFDANPGQYVK